MRADLSAAGLFRTRQKEALSVSECEAVEMRRRGNREPSHRRYGVIHRPSGRPGMTVMDWVNDGGRDAPPNTRDLWVIIAWGVGLVLFAVAVAALLVLLDIQL